MGALAAIRLIIAAAFLLFAALIVVTHYWIVYLGLRNHFKKRNDRIPSGLPLAPGLFTLVGLAIAPRAPFLNYAGLTIIVLDPMNWLLLYACVRWAVTGRWSE